MAAMRRRLLPALALRRAAPGPRPHCRFLLDAVAASASRSSGSLRLPRGSGPLLPTSSGDVVAAGRTASPRGAGALELLLLQLNMVWAWFSSSTLLQVFGALFSVWVQWISTPEGSDGMVLMLIGANVAVYTLWRLEEPRFMLNHFTTSLDNFKSGRLHTLITSAFSHIELHHLFNNMPALYIFGSVIADMFGPAFLLKLYLTGAVTGSAVFLADMAFLAPRKEGLGGWKTPMLGASSAVNAIALLEIFLYPRQLLYLYLSIPVPAALVGAGLICVDLWSIKKGQRRVAASTHLGGAFVAALVCAKLKGWF